jgi:hypothetical protein
MIEEQANTSGEGSKDAWPLQKYWPINLVKGVRVVHLAQPKQGAV